MTIKLASLSADLSKEREGDWIPVKEWPGLDPEKPYEMSPLPGLEFLVRSTNYPDYVTARQGVLEKLKQEYPDDKVPADVQARVEGQLSVEHLLLGWKGLDVEYSPDLVGTILVAEEHRVMRQMIFWCAGRVGKKKVEFVQAATKN
ncbi:MAG: hypothetical protein EOR26_04940 [Mesorhizobium sp.]|uniref:hypothetical protein n=1 Tax=unclassified Mesorhizobium TaxID=325217 RepID=UPI000FCB52BF|nr:MULTISPECIES: hypothetical protein [unclassified Mesorhizobium]RUV67020.1 hypothetical protein EOA78_31950 [Mesorhizobium sp. M5C.F.Cr.IN.023.01.1.1]RWI51046.1 MAG: hypothetical protein EOR15_06520 [Mesorhizobium sp.]RWI62034.1 MAG: hypothetical protein EOR16_03720 [Mesorhizobium sp.]RWJ13884.1 MAG: hypothetical protein EOR24_00975 [Mesorhizobium sp.]RWJ16890.1 MAG: hypothetical protein EOR25_13465 [Mesorhizobium sp.]